MTFNFGSKTIKTDAETLGNQRGLFYVLAFIIGACITDSPNYQGQLIIATPLMLVFEWTLILLNKKK